MKASSVVFFEDFINEHREELINNILTEKCAADFLNVITDTEAIIACDFTKDIKEFFEILIMYKYYPEKQNLLWIEKLFDSSRMFNILNRGNYYWELIQEDDYKYQLMIASEFGCDVYIKDKTFEAQKIYDEILKEFPDKNSICNYSILLNFLRKYAIDEKVRYELNL